ncbi:hypothetical protein EV199_3438 [Pseudobacter ginsenosidimutans]|uniref:Uncharacterized protein n=1 Tax=Pseudobacter ginsenosidimutans TaxID=661488 RepID=A0A4Q7MWJ4_9BACT|nr:hypothetical protein EV199_3438 [Pseudobacter ginsenosidimutans]
MKNWLQTAWDKDYRKSTIPGGNPFSQDLSFEIRHQTVFHGVRLKCGTAAGLKGIYNKFLLFAD